MTRPPVIITRAMPGAAETEARLVSTGYMPCLSPALELLGLPEPEFEDTAFGQIIFTSANAVRFYCETSDARDKVAWCVGPSTARAAEEAGFGDIRIGPGNGDQLTELILSDTTSADTPLLHVANDAAAGKIVSALNAAGRQASFVPLYTTQTAKALSPAAAQLIESQQPALILIHSAKGAATFHSLLGNQSLTPFTIVAISEAAAAPLKGHGARALIIASAPTEDALFEALDTACLSL